VPDAGGARIPYTGISLYIPLYPAAFMLPESTN
jgi:hypothetical protein